MDHWWARQEVDPDSDKKLEVEDFTGRIPLFLDKCVVDGKINLTTQFFRDIDQQAALFEWRIQKTYSKQDLRKYGILILPTQFR